MPVNDTLTIQIQTAAQAQLMYLSLVDAERAYIGVTESARRAHFKAKAVENGLTSWWVAMITALCWR